MSDFGTLISLFRTDGKDLSDSDIAKTETLIKEIKKRKYLDSLGEELRFKLVEADESSGAKGINIILSEYWGDEESEDEMMDYTESDQDLANDIASLLIKQLGPDFKIEVYAGGW